MSVVPVGPERHSLRGRREPGDPHGASDRVLSSDWPSPPTVAASTRCRRVGCGRDPLAALVNPSEQLRFCGERRWQCATTPPGATRTTRCTTGTSRRVRPPCSPPPRRLSRPYVGADADAIGRVVAHSTGSCSPTYQPSAVDPRHCARLLFRRPTKSLPCLDCSSGIGDGSAPRRAEFELGGLRAGRAHQRRRRRRGSSEPPGPDHPALPGDPPSPPTAAAPASSLRAGRG